MFLILTFLRLTFIMILVNIDRPITLDIILLGNST